MPEPGRQPSRWTLERDGVQLVCVDFGGDGPPVMLLHGLAGYGEEWLETASWLTTSHRVLAPDARGHAASERVPADVTRDAHVADVKAWLEHFDLGPTALVGQSLGGHTALLVAGRHPDLVSRLVVAESTPEADPHVRDEVRSWLESWRSPFPSREDALSFLGGNTLRARTWVDGLDARADGLRPRFEIDVMIASLDEVARRSYWEDWRAVHCPTLIVRAADGVPRDTVLRMTALNPNATLVEIPGAGHDVHLDRPDRWREALLAFLT